MEGQISSVPTSVELEREVDKLIVPETADENAASVIRIVYALTDFENPAAANLAAATIEAAYRRTADFRRVVADAQRKFARQVVNDNRRENFKQNFNEQKKSDEPQQTASSQVH